VAQHHVKIENPGYHFGFHRRKPRVRGIAAFGDNHPGYDRFISYTREKVPQNPSEAKSRESADFIVTFEVMLEDKIVFILQLKPPGDLAFLSRRAAADRQIRECIVDVNGLSHAIASHLCWT